MDLAAQNASLDNDYGTSHGPNSPASFVLALFVGDPLADGLELADTTEIDAEDGGTELVPNGYARATVEHADFAPASDGIKATAAPVPFPEALAEWPDTVTHWQLYADDGVTAWDGGAIADPLLDVTEAGPGPLVTVSIFYADSVEEPT